MMKKKWEVHWSRLYVCTGIETIEAETEEEAREIAEEQCENWTGSLERTSLWHGTTEADDFVIMEAK